VAFARLGPGLLPGTNHELGSLFRQGLGRLQQVTNAVVLIEVAVQVPGVGGREQLRPKPGRFLPEDTSFRQETARSGDRWVVHGRSLYTPCQNRHHGCSEGRGAVQGIASAGKVYRLVNQCARLGA
jgi:hypothetical protein